mgnify:CR=1 FL=1
MGSGPWLLARTGRPGDGVDTHVGGEQSHPCGGQQSQLDAGGKAPRVSHMLGLGYLLAVNLGQSVHKIVSGSCNTEVLCQVYYLDAVRDMVLLQEGFALAMAETEEHHVDLLEGHSVGKPHHGVAIQALVYIGEQVAGIAGTVHEYYLGLGMVEQQADEFAGRVASPSQYSYLNHWYMFFSRGSTSQHTM